MKNRKLASRYARALLDALPDHDDQRDADTFLSALARAMEQSPDLRDLLLDPAVPRSSKTKALRALVEQQGLSPRVGNFMEAIVEHGRTAELPVIAAVFHEARETSLGIVAATLTSASPLNEDLRNRARQALEKLSGSKINLTCEVQPSLIGGAVATIGSMVYDGSLRTHLARMRKEMTEE